MNALRRYASNVKDLFFRYRMLRAHTTVAAASGVVDASAARAPPHVAHAPRRPSPPNRGGARRERPRRARAARAARADCPICLQRILSSPDAVVCKNARCKAPVHRKCMVSWLEHNRADAAAPVTSKRCLLCTHNTIDMRVRVRPRQIMVQPAPPAHRRTPAPPHPARRMARPVPPPRAPPSRPRPANYRSRYRYREPREQEGFHQISPRNLQAILRALQT